MKQLTSAPGFLSIAGVYRRGSACPIASSSGADAAMV
jgi:hypothetical protein